MTTAANYRVVWGHCYLRRPGKNGDYHWMHLPDQLEVITLYDSDTQWAEHLMQAMVALCREELAARPEDVSHFRVRVVLHVNDEWGKHQLHLERTQIRRDATPVERSQDG